MISDCVGWGVGVALLKLPFLLYVFRQTNLSKQCRPRSDATGPTLFATHSAILHTLTGSKIDLLKKVYGKEQGCDYLR